jgi:glycosyltransferase involved in cell wall biosynthesis
VSVNKKTFQLEGFFVHNSKSQNNMLPKVSIIVPIYNVELYIEECLQSVMRQTYRGSIECILIDDCGTDNSMEITEQLIEVYNGPIAFKVLHHEHNRGLSAARNTGMDAACGDYVYFLDSDDWISDDCIEKLTYPLSFEQYDFVVGHYERDGKDSLVSCSEGEYHYNGLKVRKGMKGDIPVSACNKLFKKSFLFDNHLLFEVGKVYEDSILTFDMACVERKFYVVNSITYYYRRREDSITTRKNQSAIIVDYICLFQTVKDRVRQGKNKDLYRIYDYYLFWVKKVFRWISSIEMDETMLDYVQKETEGFLNVIPNIRYLSNKHDRVIYFFCRKDQTYSRYQYVKQQYTEKYAHRLSGRIMRNLLDLIPSKKVKYS